MRKKKSILIGLLITMYSVSACYNSSESPVSSQQSTSSISKFSTDDKADTSIVEPADVKPDNYPTRTIEFIVPAAAGAMIDIPTRAMLDLMDLGRPAVVINRPGGSQTVGTAEAQSKPSDGYTLLTCAPGGMLIQPHVLDLTYDIDSFRHISMIHPGDQMLVVTTPNAPFQTWQELELKIKSGEDVTYSSANPAGIGHLAMLNLLKQMDATADFVPFNGSAEGITALLGGHIDFYVIDAADSVQRIKDNQYTALLLIDNERVSTLPDVPSAGELGFEGAENFVGYKWIAIHKDTPEDIVQWLKQKMDEALMSSTYSDYLEKSNYSPLRTYTEEEITTLIKNSSDAFRAILDDLGMSK